jgi:hypothetical protein
MVKMNNTGIFLLKNKYKVAIPTREQLPEDGQYGCNM